MKTKVLLVTELCPWPIRGGQFIRLHNLIDAMTRSHDVALLAPRPPSDWPIGDHITLFFDDKSLAKKTQVFQFRLRTNPYFLDLLENALKNYRPDIVWFDFRYWGQYIPIAHKYGARAIMGTHNIQYRIKQQFGQTLKEPVSRILNFFSYQAERMHERLFFTNFDAIVAVTQDDCAYYARRFQPSKIFYLPNFIDEEAYRPSTHPNDNCTVLITASFDAYQNQIGLRWFLSDVWPRVCKILPKSRLRIAGFGADRLVSKGMAASLQIEVVDSFQNIAEIIEDVAVAAVPILHGAGSRLKILEALASRLPVVSTTLGAEGFDFQSGKNAIISDNPITFADAITTLLLHPQKRWSMAEAGFDLLKENFGFDINRRRLDQIIANTINPI